MATGNGFDSDIGEIIIDPDAELKTNGKANQAAQQEEEFYVLSGEQFRLQHNQQNLGWLGKFFGANSTAPTNIAGFVILVSLVMMFATFFFTSNSELSDTRKWLGTLVTTALGFIVGAATKK
jgi:hypothetical protein